MSMFAQACWNTVAAMQLPGGWRIATRPGAVCSRLGVLTCRTLLDAVKALKCTHQSSVPLMPHVNESLSPVTFVARPRQACAMEPAPCMIPRLGNSTARHPLLARPSMKLTSALQLALRSTSRLWTSPPTSHLQWASAAVVRIAHPDSYVIRLRAWALRAHATSPVA